MTSDQERAAPAQEPVADVAQKIADECWLDSLQKHTLARRIRRALAASEPEPRAEIERLTESRDGYAKDAAARAKECDRLREHTRKQADDIMSLGTLVYDTNSVPWMDRARAAESRVEALSAEVGKLTEANLDLRLALTPFAEVEITRIDPPDSEPVNCKHINGLFYGHFREARAALDKGSTG